MKINYFLTNLFLLFLFTNLLNAQYVYVPDDNFEQALIDFGYDIGPLNDSVLFDSIKNIRNLNLADKKIGDLTGIEKFISLEQLYCYNNYIDSLDLSSNINLDFLYCINNQLTFLNLSANSKLKTLYCNKNKLTLLDLSSNPLLSLVNCTENQLTELNIRNGNNIVIEMDARNNPDLFCIQVDNSDDSYDNPFWLKNTYTGYSEDCSTYLFEKTYIPDDNFEQVIISMQLDIGPPDDSVATPALRKIDFLDLSDKNISDITGIEGFKDIKYLRCTNNKISKLELNGNLKLEILNCQNNKISILDLSSNVNLMQLYCDNNNLKTLDLKNNIQLKNLVIRNNELTELDLRNGNNANMYIDITNNPDLFCIQVDDSVASYENSYWKKNGYASYSEDCSSFSLNMTYVPDDKFEQFLINLGFDYGNLNDSVPTNGIKHIEYLNVENNKIIDLTGIEDFEKLSTLNCEGNNIKWIDLSSNINLLSLYCNGNELSSIYLFNNNLLYSFSCKYNLLTSLDLSLNKGLAFLDCSNNNLQILNLKSGLNYNLTKMICNYNQLSCIRVDDPEKSLTYTDWIKDDTARYSLDCILNPVVNIEIKNNIFNIYPNPAYSRVFVDTENTLVKLEILNQAGSMIYSVDNFVSAWIEIEKYDPGVYIFRITDKNSDSIINKKIVVEKQ